MPVLVTDQYDNIFLICAGVTNLLDTSNYMLRHLFTNFSVNNGITWCDSLLDINSDFFQYHWTECVYPSASPVSTNDSLYILFQGDAMSGDYINDHFGSNGQHFITSNDMFLTKPSKWDIISPCWIGIDKKKTVPAMTVYQNTPNPFRNQTQVNVTLSEKGDLLLEVYSLLGQKVTEIDKGIVNPGDYQFILSGSQFTSGIYFYTVRCNNESSTHKMIVE
jgi:hypothetical protein